MPGKISTLRSWPVTLTAFLLSNLGTGEAAADEGRAALYGALPDTRMMTMSPDGNSVAYRKTTPSGDFIVVFSFDDRQLKGAIGLPDGLDPGRLRFANANHLVLTVSEFGHIRGFEGKHDVSHAHVYEIPTKKLQKLLVPGNPVYVGQRGLGRIFGISADEKFVYMPAFAGNARIAISPKYSIFEVSLENPGQPKVHFSGNAWSRDFIMDRNGDVFVHETFNSSKGIHAINVRHGDNWKEIYRKDTWIEDFDLIGVTADYESLVVATYDDASRRRSYVAMSIHDGTMTGSLFENDDADVEDVIWDLNRVVYGARLSGFNPTYKFIDPELTKRAAAMVDDFSGNSVWLTDWTSDWARFLVYVEGSNFSGHYFSIEEGKPPVLLSKARADFDDESIHPIATYRYDARDGLSIPVLLTIPSGRVSSLNKVPAVILPHGGPASHDTIGFDWFAQALADQGYLVIQPQFRGSTGFGLDHYLAGRGEWGGKMQTDLSDAIEALTRNGYIDPERVCIVGMSYGGYAALAGGAFTPSLYKCIVSINGVADVREMISTDSAVRRGKKKIIAWYEETIGDGQLDRKHLESISPFFHVDNFVAPVLLLHGENDSVVSVKQSQRMYTKLRRAKKDVQFIVLDDEGHSILSANSRHQTVIEVVKFINANLAEPSTLTESTRALATDSD